MRVQNPRSEQFSIRKAKTSDAEGILDCLAAAFAAFRGRYTPEGFSDTVLTPDTIKNRLEDMVVFVALQDDQHVIGTIGCKVEHAGEGHLRGMAVRPEWQGSAVCCGVAGHAQSEAHHQA